MNRSLEIREEIDANFDAVASLHDTAFGGGMESRIVSSIRQGDRPYLSYVALSGSRVCGHALFSEVDVIGTETSAEVSVPITSTSENRACPHTLEPLSAT